jgi:hypothetical protein
MRPCSTRIVAITLLSGLTWLVSGSTQARAGFTVSLDSAKAVGSDTQVAYSASIGSTDTLAAGDSFTVFDFAGYVDGTLVAPTGWTGVFSPALNGGTPPPGNAPTTPPNVILTHGDDPAIPNLTFTYIGATPITGPQSITGFSALSSFDTYALKDFTGVLTGNGLKVSSVGAVPAPALGGLPYPAPAPEPSSVVTGAIGLALAGFAYRRHRRTASA